MKHIGLAALTALLFSCRSPAPDEVSSLAQCLRDSGATLYGTSWCGYCTKQKEDFGDSVDLIPYVDCELQPEKCDDRIKSYPTWILGDGKVLRGRYDLDDLAREAGCKY